MDLILFLRNDNIFEVFEIIQFRLKQSRTFLIVRKKLSALHGMIYCAKILRFLYNIFAGKNIGEIYKLAHL